MTSLSRGGYSADALQPRPGIESFKYDGANFASHLLVEEDAVDAEERLHRPAGNDLFAHLGRPWRDGSTAGFGLPPTGTDV